MKRGNPHGARLLLEGSKLLALYRLISRQPLRKHAEVICHPPFHARRRATRAVQIHRLAVRPFDYQGGASAAVEIEPSHISTPRKIGFQREILA